MSEDVYYVRCDVCERDIAIYEDTGEPATEEMCIDAFSCPILSSVRDDGDPEELDFREDFSISGEYVPEDEGC